MNERQRACIFAEVVGTRFDNRIFSTECIVHNHPFFSLINLIGYKIFKNCRFYVFLVINNYLKDTRISKKLNFSSPAKSAILV